jgi:hypothetical protein
VTPDPIDNGGVDTPPAGTPGTTDPGTPGTTDPGNGSQNPVPTAQDPASGPVFESPVIGSDGSTGAFDGVIAADGPAFEAGTNTGLIPTRFGNDGNKTAAGTGVHVSGSVVTAGVPQSIAARVDAGLSSPIEAQPALTPLAPRSPLNTAHNAAPGSRSITMTTAGTGNGSSSSSGSSAPAANLPAGLLAFLGLGALILLAVTEASPRTWQFRPYTPPA